MPNTASVDEIASARFVSLTTFRRSGDPVATPVWIAMDGDAFVVTTMDGTGKVKRLRNDARVELRPCDRRGRVKPDAPVFVGHASIHDDGAARDRLSEVLHEKYRMQYTVAMGIQHLAARAERVRVMLRIVPA